MEWNVFFQFCCWCFLLGLSKGIGLELTTKHQQSQSNDRHNPKRKNSEWFLPLWCGWVSRLFSHPLVRPLSTFEREISGIGFLGIAMSQFLSATVKTRLRITSSCFRDAGERVFRRISLYLETSCGQRLISLKWPRWYFGCWIRYFSLLLPLYSGMTSFS